MNDRNTVEIYKTRPAKMIHGFTCFSGASSRHGNGSLLSTLIALIRTPTAIATEDSLPIDEVTNTAADQMDGLPMDEVTNTAADQMDEDEIDNHNWDEEGNLGINEDEDEVSVVSLQGIDHGDAERDGSMEEEGSDREMGGDDAHAGAPSFVQDDREYFSTADAETDYPIHWRQMKWNQETRNFTFVPNKTADLNGIPKVNEWSLVHPREMKKVNVSINRARETMMSHYIEEYQCFHRKLESLGIEKSPDGLFEHIYGEDSLLAAAMCQTLGIKYKELCQFLATVYFAAEFRTSAHRLEKHPAINYDGYMPKARYNEI